MGQGLGRMIGFKGASPFTDRHGKVRWRFRRKGSKTVYLPGLPGSPEFAQAYADALAGVTTMREIAADRTQPGTINALVIAFYKSAEFRVLGASTQRTYRGILERLRRDYGHLPLRGVTRERVRAMMDKRADTPAAANNVLRMMRLLMGFAVERGLRADNPAASVKPLPIKSDGFHTWTEEEIAAFEARWPLGTKERLAVDLLLYTAQRSGDVRQMGRQHVRSGFVSVRQEKTGERLEVPVHPLLQASIEAATPGRLLFVETQHGQPYSAKGFSNWISDAADKAGLPHCTAHGLRKAGARRLAEAGCSASEIAAITGHRTLKEVERYVRAATRNSSPGTPWRVSAGRMANSRWLTRTKS